MKRTVLALLIARALLAQDVSKPAASQAPATPKEAPAISVEHQRDYYRADGAMQRATKTAEDAQKSLDAARNELRDAGNVLMMDCKEEHMPSEDASKKSLVCIQKPKPAK